MGRNRQGNGDDFLEGQISEEHLEQAHHQHGEQQHHHHHGVPGHLPITMICAPGTIGAGCCWIVLATTNCSTTAPNGTTCCWRILATTDCTTTVGGAACCWHILSTTDCTNLNCSDDS